MYNVESYLKKSVESYLSLLPQGTQLKRVPTPFLASRCGPDVRAPTKTGPSVTCPWCRGCFLESELCKEDVKKNCAKGVKGRCPPQTTPSENVPPPPRGALADKAASVLMQVLYVARYARFDYLCAMARLAQKISKWTKECDLALHRLMSYIHSTLDFRLVGFVGDSIEDVRVHVYVDVDFAGDPSTKRSTTGVQVCLCGSATYFPINCQSKRQECVCHSTTQAETVFEDLVLRQEGIPALTLWDGISGQGQEAVFTEGA